ncbi:MAG: hypothetical protein ACRYG8_10240 [Janthinobacterium lividum]
MPADPEKIADLEEIVRVARDEFDEVIAFHELWRPMVMDTELHERLGKSYATNAFLTLRDAIHLQVLLGLTKLWDRDTRSVSMPRVIEALASTEIVDFFGARCAAQWGKLPMNFGQKLPEEERLALRKSGEESERRFGLKQAVKLRTSVSEMLDILRDYHEGDKKDVLIHLRHLRNKHIAHRDLNPPPPKQLRHPKMTKLLSSSI